MGLVTLERPADGEAEGALVLLHGRGAGESQLVELLELLDPERRLLGLAPRAPHAHGQGAHWYEVERAGVPERESFLCSCRLASEWLDGLGFAPGRIVLGGFSQGATMSYALALGAARRRPAALIALSGYLPAVGGWEIDLGAPLPPVAIGHGALDDVISVEFARAARSQLESAGAELLYRESPLGHAIDPIFVGELATWLRARIETEHSAA
jgi:phospholipase/carboxylesterase